MGDYPRKADGRCIFSPEFKRDVVKRESLDVSLRWGSKPANPVRTEFGLVGSPGVTQREPAASRCVPLPSYLATTSLPTRAEPPESSRTK